MLSKLLSLILIFSSLGMDAICRYENQLSLGGNLFLVNRDYRISADYVPNDLVMPQVKRTSDSVLLRPEAADALERLFQAAKEEAGYSLVAVSGFRSYQTQSLIFNRRLKSVGRQKTMLFVALPGASEHQLGLAMDVARQKNTSLNASFGSSPEGIWLAENCYRFGFILRYQEQWTEITGYAYEPWHIRYVGEEHALRIQELDIPLEEYISALRTTIDLFSTENE